MRRLASRASIRSYSATALSWAVRRTRSARPRGASSEGRPRAPGAAAPPYTPRVEDAFGGASLNTHNAQRDDDLRGSYFLELDKYPTITFRSTKVEPLGQDRYALTGDMTIKGI